jgi:hypothetical protein
VQKVQEYMFGTGPMTPAASIARMQQRIPQVEPAIIAEAARWGDSRVTTPLNKTTWLSEVSWLINTYFPTRTTTVIGQLRADGLYVSAPTFNFASGTLPVNSPLALTAPGNIAGAIYYTTDGVTDPRLPGGGVNPSAQVKVYMGVIPLNGVNQTFKARYRTTSGDWSLLTQATYTTYLPGDYTPDSIVDGMDFLTWQQQLGSSASPVGSGADGNRSGFVEESDLAAWASYFGYGGSSVQSTIASAVVAAPELADPVTTSMRLAARSHKAADAALSDAAAWSNHGNWAVDAPIARAATRFRPANSKHEESPAERTSVLDTLLADSKFALR